MWQIEVTKYDSSVEYKVWQEWVTKCHRLKITKCDKMDYKVCQGGLKSVAGITKRNGITKCGDTRHYNYRKSVHIFINLVRTNAL